jgi:hypothetical protein
MFGLRKYKKSKTSWFAHKKENKVYRWKSEESADEKKQSKKRFYQKRKRTKTGR